MLVGHTAGQAKAETREWLWRVAHATRAPGELSQPSSMVIRDGAKDDEARGRRAHTVTMDLAGDGELDDTLAEE